MDAFASRAATAISNTGTAKATAPQRPAKPVTRAAASTVTRANMLATTDRQNWASLRNGSATSLDRMVAVCRETQQVVRVPPYA